MVCYPSDLLSYDHNLSYRYWKKEIILYNKGELFMNELYSDIGKNRYSYKKCFITYQTNDNIIHSIPFFIQFYDTYYLLSYVNHRLELNYNDEDVLIVNNIINKWIYSIQLEDVYLRSIGLDQYVQKIN